MCSKAKQFRTDKNAAVKEKEATAEEKRQRGYREKISHDAQRIVKAADAAGLGKKTKLTFGSYGREYPIKTIRAFANGDFGDAHFYGTDAFQPDAKHVPELCRTLHCSADYLLGLTEDLHPAPASGSAPLMWRTDSEYPDGIILALFRFQGSGDIQKVMYARDGELYFPHGSNSRVDPVLWLAIPPIPHGHICSVRALVRVDGAFHPLDFQFTERVFDVIDRLRCVCRRERMKHLIRNSRLTCQMQKHVRVLSSGVSNHKRLLAKEEISWRYGGTA